MTILELLKTTIDKKASDLHLLVGSPPMLRIEGKLIPIPGMSVLEAATVEKIVLSTMSPEQRERFLKFKELDFSLEVPGVSRFRVNAYTQRGTYGLAMRSIVENIPMIEDLGLPSICHAFTNLRQGFVLVTGPTGHGKSTTLAAILEQINKTRDVHIVTIEDPVEFVYTNKKAIISQRELGGDTKSFGAALRSALRQDPDVVMIGEMRDPETMSAAITIAETGHLVFATLHTNSSAQTIDRIIDSFPENQQQQIRIQLAASLEAVLSQRLLPSTAEGGRRVLATEMLVATPAVRSVIRDGKSHQIDNIIATSGEMGMYLLENSLIELLSKNMISHEVAMNYSIRPSVLSRLMGSL